MVGLFANSIDPDQTPCPILGSPVFNGLNFLLVWWTILLFFKSSQNFGNLSSTMGGDPSAKAPLMQNGGEIFSFSIHVKGMLNG